MGRPADEADGSAAGADGRILTGILGEDAARAHYLAGGYRVLARNWRCRLGELDLVVVRGDSLVVVEVKTRRGSRFGGGFEAVGPRKQQKVRTVAEAFLLQGRVRPESVRFDVVSVWLRPDGSTAIEVFEDAF
jgi:putative endonuclease